MSEIEHKNKDMQSINKRAQYLAENLRDVLRKINDANPRSFVRLVAVSKYKCASDILALYQETGHTHMGENYVQELLSKASELPKAINWHFIGQLQTNKCKQLAKLPNLWVIESLDSIKKAEILEKARASSGNSNLKVYVQVNTSGEASKSGCEPLEAWNICLYVIRQCPHLLLQGLMTIGSLASSQANCHENSEFSTLSELRSSLRTKLDLELELSMGMSQDFETAVRMGATNVRVGTAIFGCRSLKPDS